MEIQKYLRSGKTLEKLNTEFAIKICMHSTLPLVILNYDQISTPKTNKLCMECRGLILEVGTWNIVARSFDRFFNLGECEELQKDFDWSDFMALEKVDGSLINMFFYAGEWHMATRGSFGEGLMENCNFSWKELFWDTFHKMFNIDMFQETRSITFELCSRYNKIVTDYPEPTLFWLNSYCKVYNRFEDYRNFYYRSTYGSPYPTAHYFKSIDEVIKHIENLEVNDPTIEGVVLVDKNLNRIKVKNKKYLSLHKMRGESGFTMKNLLPFVLDGETDELLTYYPEVQDKINKMIEILDGYYKEFVKVWSGVVFIEDQKEFAIALNSFNFSSQDALFTAKKNGILGEGGKVWSTIIVKHPKLYERVFKAYDKESL